MLRTTLRKILVVAVVLVVGTFAWTMLAQANATDDGHAAAIRGAGTSLVRGGTGSPSFTPVMTKFGFNWRSGEGGFECLALVPSVAAGKPGSGNFDTNAMYVTGSLTSALVRGQSAVLTGTATVTGLGAGTNVPFTATVTRGGPGATLVLEVSGLTFSEIVLEGEIRF
jgi:uncharacterized protein with beta-barrel porin domain